MAPAMGTNSPTENAQKASKGTTVSYFLLLCDRYNTILSVGCARGGEPFGVVAFRRKKDALCAAYNLPTSPMVAVKGKVLESLPGEPGQELRFLWYSLDSRQYVELPGPKRDRPTLVTCERIDKRPGVEFVVATRFTLSEDCQFLGTMLVTEEGLVEG